MFTIVAIWSHKLRQAYLFGSWISSLATSQNHHCRVASAAAYLTRINLAFASISSANHSVDNTKPRVSIAIRSASFGLSPHNRVAVSVSLASLQPHAGLPPRPSILLVLVSFGIRLLGRRFLKGTCSFLHGICPPRHARKASQRGSALLFSPRSRPPRCSPLPARRPQWPCEVRLPNMHLASNLYCASWSQVANAID